MSESIEQHKYYELAYRAHTGTSFSPEKRAASECAYYDEICEEFRNAGKDSAIEKFTTLFIKSMSAKSRTFSTMISGPANYPVARQEKLRGYEHNATESLINFVAKVRKPPAQPRTELDYGIKSGEKQYTHFKAVKNLEENRLQLFFAGKPEEEIRAILKKNGYKWSPRNTAWQRQLTPNAISNLRHVLDEVAIAKGEKCVD
jgi:hypothetical protein